MVISISHIVPERRDTFTNSQNNHTYFHLFSSLSDAISMAYQANASPFQSWRPFAREPAISLTQNLPPEIDAKCLILGCGDARNILFTIFNDENDRIFSFCIDADEQISKGRTTLLVVTLNPQFSV